MGRYFPCSRLFFCNKIHCLLKNRRIIQRFQENYKCPTVVIVDETLGKHTQLTMWKTFLFIEEFPDSDVQTTNLIGFGNNEG